MNPRPQSFRAAAAVTVTATTSTDDAPSWCPACKAFTVLTGVVVMLTPNGTSVADRWKWCEICDDPADPAAGTPWRPGDGR